MATISVYRPVLNLLPADIEAVEEVFRTTQEGLSKAAVKAVVFNTEPELWGNILMPWEVPSFCQKFDLPHGPNIVRDLGDFLDDTLPTSVDEVSESPTLPGSVYNPKGNRLVYELGAGILETMREKEIVRAKIAEFYEIDADQAKSSWPDTEHTNRVLLAYTAQHNRHLIMREIGKAAGSGTLPEILEFGPLAIEEL